MCGTYRGRAGERPFRDNSATIVIPTNAIPVIAPSGERLSTGRQRRLDTISPAEQRLFLSVSFTIF